MFRGVPKVALSRVIPVVSCLGSNMSTVSYFRDEDMDETEYGDYVIYFGDDARIAVKIPVYVADWECVLKQKTCMNGQFVDFLLRHLVLRSPENVSRQYVVAESQVINVLTAHLQECSGDWEWLGRFGIRWLAGCSGGENTLVIPYCDKDHWTLFVVEEATTYHLGSLLNIHDTEARDNFVTLVHIAWASSRGIVPGSQDWWKLLSRGSVSLKAPNQKESWECGYAMSFQFWQFMVTRGSAFRFPMPVEKIKKKRWVKWSGHQMQLWFLEQLYIETARADDRFPKPRICKASTGDLPNLSEVDIVVPDYVVENRGVQVYGISSAMRRTGYPVHAFEIHAVPPPDVEEEEDTKKRVGSATKSRKSKREMLEKMLQSPSGSSRRRL